MWTEHSLSCLFSGCKISGGHVENKTPNVTKYPFRGLSLWRAWGSWTRPLLYTRTEPIAEDQNGYWEVTIIVIHYLCLVPEKRFSFCNISVPIKLRTLCRIQIPPKGVSLQKFTSCTATGIYGFLFNSCSLINLSFSGHEVDSFIFLLNILSKFQPCKLTAFLYRGINYRTELEHTSKNKKILQ